jgi:hypothetical protein
VLVFPELSMIIAATANLEGVDPTEAGEQEEAIATFITDGVFPALTDVELEGP